MNHEPSSPTPALRLKPRLRPADGAPVDESKPAAPATGPAVAAPPPPTSGPAPAPGEGVKFKLKPKTDSPVSVPTAAAPVVPASLLRELSAPDATIPPRSVMPPPAVAAPNVARPASESAPTPPSNATRPPFPRFQTVTQPSVPAPAPSPARRTAVPFGVPHLKVNVDVPEVAPPPPVAPPEKRSAARYLIGAVIAILVLGVCGFFGWKYFSVPGAAPAKTETAPAAPAAASAPASAPVPAKPAAPSAGPTPSDSLNKIAAAPANAIQKAQDAIAARRASGQARIDAAVLGEDQPAKAGSPPKPATSPSGGTSTAMTPLTPNLAATTQLEAAPEASPAFLAWVVNARVNGVFQGSSGRAMINGRLTRIGETVDGTLGIVFASIEADKKQLIFKDHSGATVTRKY